MSANAKLKILALDQASKLGWCCGKELYGIWDLKIRPDESQGMKWIRLRAKLREIIESEKIDLVVYERAASQFAKSVIHAAKMIGIIEATCEEMGINYSAYSATEIKLFATGSGKAKKEDMIKAAHDQYGYPGDDDNEADAMHIFYLATYQYNK